MNKHNLSRREALSRSGVLVAAAAVAGEKLAFSGALANPSPQTSERAFLYCLNTATIRGQKLGITKEIEVAGKAGYDAIEPWISSIQDYVKGGGTLPDLKKQISDAGLRMESAIGFPEWIVDDEERRAKGLERAKREMEIVAQLGGKRFGVPPAGATDLTKLDFMKAAERY